MNKLAPHQQPPLPEREGTSVFCYKPAQVPPASERAAGRANFHQHPAGISTALIFAFRKKGQQRHAATSSSGNRAEWGHFLWQKDGHVIWETWGGAHNKEDRRPEERELESDVASIWEYAQDLSCESLSRLLISTYSQMLVGSRLWR